MAIEFLRSGLLSPIKRWGTHWSLWVVHLLTACCGVELAHTYACGFDAERWGSLEYGMMKQTNLIVVEGAITNKMARVLRVTWEQMPEPKFVIVMGSCGLKGGLFWNSYHMVKPSDVVPVDSFIPGCPPTPEALIRSIRSIQEGIATGEIHTTAKYKEVDLSSVVEMPEKAKKPRKLPKSPRKIAKEPEIRIEPKEVEWDFGDELIGKLEGMLEGLYKSVMVTDVNRLYIDAERDKVPLIAEKLQDDFDHVKSVNVIDVPHENKFIVEYVISSYERRELMPVLLTISSEIPRDKPKSPSLIEYWPSADYQEREMHDLFGVIFEGNPWMGNKFLLAPEVENPLRKDFALKEETHMLEVDE